MPCKAWSFWPSGPLEILSFGAPGPTGAYFKLAALGYVEPQVC